MTDAPTAARRFDRGNVEQKFVRNQPVGGLAVLTANCAAKARW